MLNPSLPNRHHFFHVFQACREQGCAAIIPRCFEPYRSFRVATACPGCDRV